MQVLRNLSGFSRSSFSLNYYHLQSSIDSNCLLQHKQSISKTSTVYHTGSTGLDYPVFPMHTKGCQS